MPIEAAQRLAVVGQLTTRFRCTPDAVLGMDASALGLLALERMQQGRPDPWKGLGLDGSD